MNIIAETACNARSFFDIFGEICYNREETG